MKNTIAIAAIAGIASAAAAQNVTLNIVASQTLVNSNTTSMITLSVYGSADFGTHVAGGGFSLSAAGGAGVIGAMDGTAEAWGGIGENDIGDGGDGNYTGIVFGQLIAPPFFPPAPESDFSAGETLLVTFTVQIIAGSSGVIDWSTAIAPVGGGVILNIFDAGDGSLTDVFSATFGSTGAVTVVPAPSAMALLGLGGLVAGRRRR
ncbi:MAG: PEP-CTERM sorting domain-containing protein [Phycisphaerales bacterium]|nr:PEP-CTERM sorting domain-containing protein [Phycisphaerales bacterium]